MLPELLNNLEGYRKVVVTLVAFLGSVILLVTHQINADQWVELNKFVLPAFMAANLGEYVMNALNGSRRGDQGDR